MNKVKTTRAALKMTQTRFAKALGMSQSAISKMENGALKIDRRTSLAIDALIEKAKKGKVKGHGGLVQLQAEGSANVS